MHHQSNRDPKIGVRGFIKVAATRLRGHEGKLTKKKFTAVRLHGHTATRPRRETFEIDTPIHVTNTLSGSVFSHVSRFTRQCELEKMKKFQFFCCSAQ